MIKAIRNTDYRCLRKFIFNMGIKGMRGFARYQRRMKRGDFFPAFHFISVTDQCNLHCQGCWVTGKKKNNQLPVEEVDRIISETKLQKSYFFGILGGEPLLYKPLPEIFRKHSDCYFQLFTNGTLLTPAVAEELRKCANVTPCISFEGNEKVADVRRGGINVYARTRQAIDNATKAGLITGVAISVCKSNLEMATSDEFIQSLIDQKVMYLWYYIYRPVGENAMPSLALSADEILRLRKHILDARSRFGIAVIDTYWNEKGEPFCPAAKGLSHHINASGDIEPCPVIQFSTDSVFAGKLIDIYHQSAFLNEVRTVFPKLSNGCPVMDNPQQLVDFIGSHDAKDSSGRSNEYDRLNEMPPVDSHGFCPVIPEKRWIYRFAKRRAFFGLGAYG
ncbi:MAG TPA: radical SAM protein [Prolixibacteraceae bacterium]|nr:radical SAM protein [Prolixibacteraceae bacterium]